MPSTKTVTGKVWVVTDGGYTARPFLAPLLKAGTVTKACHGGRLHVYPVRKRPTKRPTGGGDGERSNVET